MLAEFLMTEMADKVFSESEPLPKKLRADQERQVVWIDIVIILIKINTFQNIILVHIHIFTRA